MSAPVGVWVYGPYGVKTMTTAVGSYVAEFGGKAVKALAVPFSTNDIIAKVQAMLVNLSFLSSGYTGDPGFYDSYVYSAIARFQGQYMTVGDYPKGILDVRTFLKIEEKYNEFLDAAGINTVSNPTNEVLTPLESMASVVTVENATSVAKYGMILAGLYFISKKY